MRASPIEVPDAIPGIPHFSATARAIRFTGIGIPPEAMARLFSEFFRADNAKVHSRMGTGLGLSIVYGIIEKHHGRISVESKEGEGTRFTIRMPYNPQVKSERAAS